MRNIYCLSGLGADERAFANLRNCGLPLKYLPYPHPLGSETLEDFARRLANHICEPQPVLLGVSFGGIVALEMARILAARQILLISSVRRAAEMPPEYHVAGSLGLARAAAHVPKFVHRIVASLFFAPLQPLDKPLLHSIIDDTDPAFLRWALQAVLSWPDRAPPAHVVQIHGTHDRIFPARYINSDYWIAGGGHFMVHNRADEISGLLTGLLSS